MSWPGFRIQRCQVGVRIGVATSSILTLIAQRIVLANLLPRLPCMTRPDYFTVGSTLLVFLALIGVVATSCLVPSTGSQWRNGWTCGHAACSRQPYCCCWAGSCPGDAAHMPVLGRHSQYDILKLRCRHPVAGHRCHPGRCPWASEPAKTRKSGEKLWKSRARVQYHVGHPDIPGPVRLLKASFTPANQRSFGN
jgi:hypothetical protein